MVVIKVRDDFDGVGVRPLDLCGSCSKTTGVVVRLIMYLIYGFHVKI